MQPEPRDMQAEFQALGLLLHWVDLGNGLSRYWALLCHSYRLCRRLRARSVMSFPLVGMPLWPSVPAWLVHPGFVPMSAIHHRSGLVPHLGSSS